MKSGKSKVWETPLELSQRFDAGKPDWLELRIAAFIQNHYWNLATRLMSPDTEGINWEHPWMRIWQEVIWKPGELPSETGFTMVHDWMHKGAGAGLGHDFWHYVHAAIFEYLTWGTGIRFGTGGEITFLAHNRYAPIIHRLDEQKRAELVHKLSGSLVFGLEPSEPVAPPTGTIADLAIAKELNRLRALINPFLKFDWGSVVVIFRPYEVHDVDNVAFFSMTIGFDLTPENVEKLNSMSSEQKRDLLWDSQPQIHEAFELGCKCRPARLNSGALVISIPSGAETSEAKWKECVRDLFARSEHHASSIAYTGEPVTFGKEPDPNPVKRLENQFVATPRQERVLKALGGAALSAEAIATETKISRRALYKDRKKKGILQELVDQGQVKKHPRLGYYRPDALPPELQESK